MNYTYDVETFKDCFEHEFTWINGFMRNVARYPNKNAIYYNIDGKSWTYAQLNADANRLAHAFIQDQLERNDVVMHMLFNSPEFIFSYIASQKAGLINCPVNYRMAPGELAILLEDSKPAVFIYDSFFLDTVKDALKLASYVPPRMVFTGEAKEAMPGHISFADYISSQSSANPVLDRKIHIYEETTRLYTSGTTNRAKAVPINSLNEVLSAHDVIMHYPLNERDRTMNLTPWFHRGGIHIGGPTPTLYVGGEVIILREFKPRACLELIQKEKVTYVTGVPSIFALLARAQKSIHADLSSLRGLCSMGSPFSRASLEEYRKLFTPNILNGYGTTETFVNTYMRPWSPLEKCSATGQSCIDDDVRLVKIIKSGHAEPDDLVARDNRETGEIIIKAPNKSTGAYVNNPEMTAQKFYKNFHYTGDVGVWDEDGYITVLCRKDDMIICSGENIYPSQIEAALDENPKVAESAVIGKPDKLHGECVTAYIVSADDSLTVEELRAWCAAHPMLPSYKRPKFFHIVKELPHTATGKLMHYKLRDGQNN